MKDSPQAAFGTQPAITTRYEAVVALAAVEQLRGSIRGTVLQPGDAGYEEARQVWNGMIDRHPALIVRCSGTADVIAAVRFAREQNLTVAVRGGGHNVAGSAVCDGGLVIDLSPMKSVRVDPQRRVARVGGGARLAEVDHETQAFGLATPLGLMSVTGVSGLTLHGGVGLLMRKYGLSSDNLAAADVVTADGRLLTVDENRHADLLWALRGGGGNFGVVTSLEFRLHPVGPEVWMAIVMYPLEKAQKVLGFFRDFMAQAPDELSAFASFWSAPHEEPIPEAYRGAPALIVGGCYCGPLEQGESAIQPLREVDTPFADLSGPMPFLMAQQLFDPEYPSGRRYYWKSAFLRELGDEVVATLAGHAARRPSPLTSLDLLALGGAFGRVRPEETAFAVRDAAFMLAIEANWDDPADDAANIAWTREVHGDVQRFSHSGSYLNFPGFGEEGEALVRASYGGNYARLQAIKAKYDPENFFRHNLNIRGDGGQAASVAEQPPRRSPLETQQLGLAAINDHDAGALAALYAPGVVVHDPFYAEPLQGRDAAREDFEGFLRAFPDLRLEASDVVVSGDTLAYGARFSGTNTGPLQSPDGQIAATHRRVEMCIAVFARVNEAGLVEEERRYYDAEDFVRQLGLAP
jgi:FAD/FMN-containing dehydrogenase/predicted ester cyclase